MCINTRDFPGTLQLFYDQVLGIIIIKTQTSPGTSIVLNTKFLPDPYLVPA